MNPIERRFPLPVLQSFYESQGDEEETLQSTMWSIGKRKFFHKCQKSIKCQQSVECQKSVLGTVQKLPEMYEIFGEPCTHRFGSVFGSKKNIETLFFCYEEIRQFSPELYKFIMKETSGSCAFVCLDKSPYLKERNRFGYRRPIFPENSYGSRYLKKIRSLQNFDAVIAVDINQLTSGAPVSLNNVVSHEWMHQYTAANLSKRLGAPSCISHSLSPCDPCITVNESNKLLRAFKKSLREFEINGKGAAVFTPLERYWGDVEIKQLVVKTIEGKVNTTTGIIQNNFKNLLTKEKLELEKAVSKLRSEIPAYLMRTEASGEELNMGAKRIGKVLNDIYGEKIFKTSSLMATLRKNIKGVSRFISRASGPLVLAWDIYQGIQEEKDRVGSCKYNPVHVAVRNGAIGGAVRFASESLLMYQEMAGSIDPHVKLQWHKNEQLLIDKLKKFAEKHTPSDALVVAGVIETIYEDVKDFKIPDDLFKSPEKAAEWAIALRDAAEKSQKETLEKYSEINAFLDSIPNDFDWKIIRSGEEQKATCAIPIGEFESSEFDNLSQILGSEEFSRKLDEQVILASEIHPRSTSVKHDPVAPAGTRRKRTPEAPKLTGVSLGPICPALPHSAGIVLDFDSAASVGLGVSPMELTGKGLQEGGGGLCFAVTVALSKEGIAALCSQGFLLSSGIGIGAIALGATIRYFYKKKRKRDEVGMNNSLENTRRQNLFLFEKLVPATEVLQEKVQKGLISPSEGRQQYDSHIRHMSDEMTHADHRAKTAERRGNKEKRNFHHSALEDWAWLLRDLKYQRDDLAAKETAENALQPLLNQKVPKLFSHLVEAVENQDYNPTVSNYYFICGLTKQILETVNLNLESDATLVLEMSELKIRRPFEFPIYEINEKAYGKLHPDSVGDYLEIVKRIRNANLQMSLNSVDASEVRIDVINFMKMTLRKWERKKDSRRTFEEDGETVTISKQQYKALCGFLKDTTDLYEEILEVYEEEGNAPHSLFLPVDLPEPVLEESVSEQLKEWNEREKQFERRLDHVTLFVKRSLDLAQRHLQRFGTPLQQKVTSICVEANHLFPNIVGMGLLYPFSRRMGDREMWEEKWRDVLNKRLQGIKRPFHSLDNFNSSVQTAISILTITTEFIDLKQEERAALSVLSLGARALSDITDLHKGYLKYLESGTIGPEMTSLGLRTVVDLSQWALKGKDGELNENPEYYENWEVARFCAEAPLMAVSPLHFGFNLFRLGYYGYTNYGEEQALEAMLRNIEARKRNPEDYRKLSRYLSDKMKTPSRIYKESDSKTVKSAKLTLFHYEMSNLYLNKAYEKIIGLTELEPSLNYTKKNHFPLSQIIAPLMWRLEALLHLGQVSAKEFKSNFLQVKETVNDYIETHKSRRDLKGDRDFQDYLKSLNDSIDVFEIERHFYAIREMILDDENHDLMEFDKLIAKTKKKIKKCPHNLKSYGNKKLEQLQQIYQSMIHAGANLAYQFASKKEPLKSLRYVEWVEKALESYAIENTYEVLTLIGGAKLSYSSLRALQTLEQIPYGDRSHLAWFFIAEAFYKHVTTRSNLTLLGQHHFHLALEHCIENFILKYHLFKKSAVFENLKTQEQQLHRQCAERMTNWRIEIMKFQSRRCLTTLNEDPNAFKGRLFSAKLHSFDLNTSFPLSSRVTKLNKSALAIKIFAFFCFCMMMIRFIPKRIQLS